MDSKQRKRRSHVPSRSEAVKLPKSRCSRKKFLSIMDTLPMDKKNAISDMDSGLAAAWLHGTPNRTYDIKILEANLRDLPVGEEFMKSFLIFACATILAPNSKQEGMHDLWDTVWDSEVGVRKNWAKFVLQYVEDGIRDYRTSHPTYIRGCVLFLQDSSKSRGAWLRNTHLWQLWPCLGYTGSKPSAHNDGRPYETLPHYVQGPVEDKVVALTPPEEAVNVERKKDEGSIGVHPCSDEMMRKGTGAASTHSGQQRVTSATIDDGPCIDHDTFPPSQKSAELQSLKGVQMGVQEAAICKSPFVSQCVQLFPKISQQERLVADYALSEDGEPSEILCDMHGTYITRDEFLRSMEAVGLCVSCKNKWTGGASQPYGKKSMKSESGVGCSFMLNLWAMISQVVICYFFPSATTTIALHVVNIPASRVEILSSLPLRRGNRISAVSRCLSDAIDKAFHAHGMLRRLEVSKFHHVQPQIVQQLNGYDCGMFAIKYIEHWNEATLEHSIAEDKMHLYRLRLVVTLVTNVANNARDKVLKACRI
ncbi:hypothetical protein CK203_108209 [Vitis vinifera]|uniref:Ubiquitin-like protease family profile domain-containing protein n=1 Tax=Vitis vinifera TaxID=29760 RepID=A0A438CEU8_VITVI|nr:hypothetical protein CK203_108209 [Vitis vinifera]